MALHVAVIGAGFSGISAACELGKHGCNVTVFEKNEAAGGRASVYESDGFVFDMGPSWYWMPDVFEWFFQHHGSSVHEHYTLTQLDPAYRIFFSKHDIVDIPADYQELLQLFESIEPGSASHLKVFLDDAKYKYDVGMKELVFQPCNSVFEFVDVRMLKALFKINLFSSLRTEIHKHFKSDTLRRILEFPVYFLGALPSNTPALYSILNYADLVLGTWYPHGGMGKIIEGMVDVALSYGVTFEYNSAVEKITTMKGGVKSLRVNNIDRDFDAVIASSDYHHVEQKLLDPQDRQYNEKYWSSKVFAPSCLVYYLGVKGSINGLLHHNLFFDASFDVFADEIYTNPRWPSDPLFYVCSPSKSDASVAPHGCENLFILIPIAPGLEETEEILEHYFVRAMDKLENYVKESVRDRIIHKRTFSHRDFVSRYNSYKGNAYGLANTLLQTAVLKPKMRSKRVKNLWYAGQLTVPGPGVPPSLISGYIAARELMKAMRS